MSKRNSGQLPRQSRSPEPGQWAGSADGGQQQQRMPAPLRMGSNSQQLAAAMSPQQRASQQSPSPEPGHGSPSPPGALSRELSQNLDGMEPGGPDPFFSGHELYRALRGSQGDDPLNDELLWDGDFLTSQREFIQKKQEEQMLERLERRMGRIKAAPKEAAAAAAPAETAAADATAAAAAAGSSSSGAADRFAAAASTGAKLKNLFGRIMPKGSTAAEDGGASPASPGASLPTSPIKGSATTPTTSGDGTAAGAQQVSSSADGGRTSTSNSTPTTPRLFTRLVSSFGLGSPRGPNLGNLVAEDESKEKGKAPATVVAAAAPADGVVEVNTLAARKSAQKAAEAKAKEEHEAMQRLDTAGRLELGATVEQYSWIRRTAIKICTHSDFELIVLLLIFGNCISLAAYDPTHTVGESSRNRLLQDIDLGMNVAFTVEMVLRIMSMGGVLSYLHHPWNAFDAVMVLAGYTTFIPVSEAGGSGLEGIKALRALRAMRPLRTITRFPALRSIVVCFLEAVPLLVSVAAMLFLFLFLFAVAGTEMFGEAFHHGCIDPATGDREADATRVADEFGCGDRQCPPAFNTCHKFPFSQSTEVAGFDNVGLSMLSVFQAMTLSNWSFTMFRTMDYLNPAVAIYWLAMIIFGSYFVLNLFLAVLKTKFAKAKNLLDEKRRHRRALKGNKSSKRQNVLVRASGWVKGRVGAFVAARAGRDSLASHISDVVAKKAASEDNFGTPRSNMTGLTGFTEFVGPGAKVASENAPGAGAAWGQAPEGGAVPAAAPVPHTSTAGALTRSLSNVSAAAGRAAPSGAVAGSGGEAKPALERQLSRSNSMGSGCSGYSAYTGVTGVTGMSGMSGTSEMCLLSIEEFDESVQDLPPVKRSLMMLQYRIRVVVCSGWFNNIFIVAILLNTVALAMTHEGMSHEFEEALHQANFAFTYIFTFEMVAKVIGLGPWKYLTDPWSLFDAVVVAFSLIELITELMARSNASGLTALRSVRSLRVLRSFRVLRVMKMFKYLESLKMIASVLISSMGSFASIVILLVLFWLVFSIMGLHVFGNLKLDKPWPNCDDLINSLILNFNTLNLENFQTNMYSFIRATNYASSAYWLAWIILGKYIFLTLFLAVTLDAFERKYEVDMKKGVRSQSMASTVFSRIKKAGQRIKSVAASVAGSNSGKSGMFGSLWGGGSATSKSQGSASGHDSSKTAKSAASGAGDAVVHDAIAAFRGVGDESGSAVVTVTAGAQAHQRSATREERQGAEQGRRSSIDERHGGVERRRSSEHQHHQPDRRRSTDSRSNNQPQQHPRQQQQQVGGAGTRGAKGPVGEGALSMQESYEGWGSGLRKRRHRLGLQQQYGLIQLGRNSSTGGGGGSGSGSRNGSRPVSADREGGVVAADCGSLIGRRYLRRSSSGGGSSISSTNSYTLKQEAAAAFAAAAAAEALLPLHAFPELVDSDEDGCYWPAATAGGDSSVGALKAHPDGYSHALADALHLTEAKGSRSCSGRSGSSSSSSRPQSGSGSHSSAEDEGENPFTWQEFLSTVAAIDYPHVVRQQKLLEQRQQQQQGSNSFKGADAASQLGPIAEGVEPRAGGSPYNGPATASRPSLALEEDAGTATLSHGVGVAAAAAAAAALSGEGGVGGLLPKPPGSPKPANTGRSIRSQQLALDTLDNELQSLGIRSLEPEPGTPCMLVHGQSSDAAAAATAGPRSRRLNSANGASGVSSQWPGLHDEDLQHDDMGSAAAAASGVRAQPGLVSPALSDHHRESSSPDAAAGDGSKPAAGDRAGSGGAAHPPPPAKRVTLFTESMKQRVDSTVEPPSPKFRYNPNSTPSHPSNLKGGSAAPDVDELLESPQSARASGVAGVAGVAEFGAASGPQELLLLHSASSGVTGTDALLLGGPGGFSEPSITAKAIKRRKAAGGVSFAVDPAAASAGGLPGGVEDAGAATRTDSLHNQSGRHGAMSDAASSVADTIGVESSAASESRSQAASGAQARRLSRSHSMNSDGGMSDGGMSYNSGGQAHSVGSQSGAWSVNGTNRRTRTFPDLSGTSLYLFRENNPFRVRLYKIVTSRWFDYFMFLFIILNCVAMAYEYPHMSDETLDGQILFWSDVVFTICFSIESILKIIAYGFKPYLSFFQNWVDFIIVLTSLAFLFLDTLDLEVVKALRVLRAIKPLRALTRSAGMQLIFKSLTLSLAAMGNVSIVVLLFFLIFAILGVQLFHGKFYSCNDTSVPDKDACTGTFMVDGLEVARKWSNQPYNFDNLGMGLVSLFVTATLNGYTDIMVAAMAAPEEPNMQPQPMNNWSSFFFFAAFVLVVAYTLLNLYIGVVFYQFSRIRLQSQTGSAFLTDDQTEWVELSRLVFRLKPPEKSPVPVNKFRKKLYYMVQSKMFEYVLMVVIVANSALMATTYYGQPELMIKVVEALNYAFTCIYVMEFLVKIGGLGWTNYWKNTWNKFDLLLLITSVVDMAVALALGSHASFLKVQKIMRLLRLARVVKLMRSMKGLRSLFGTLIVSLPAFWNVGALLGLLFFMYAYVGMLLLGRIKRNGGLNEHTNFERFWTAALTLFKVATNDNWTDVMTACMIGPPDCDPGLGECGSWVVYPYFVSFVVVVSIIMLNLFTAVILESFEAQQEQDRWKLRPDHLDEFVDLWAEYDDGSGTIDPKDLEGMLLRLSPPLGLGASASSTDVLRFVFDLDIPLLAGRVPFQRTAYELVRRCSGAEIPEGILKDQIDRLVSRAFRNLKADEVLNFSVAVTVMRVQRKWRARMRAAKLKRKREFRAERGVAPAYADVVAARDAVLKSALQRRQAGDLRWRPNATYAQQWTAAEAVLAAEQAAAAAAAAAAACSRSRSFRKNSDSSGADPGDAHWSSLANFRASADGWMHKVTDGLQRLKMGRFFSGNGEGATSGRSSMWGFGGSRASSKAVSAATSRAVSETASRAVSETASRGVSDAASMAVSVASMAVSTVGEPESRAESLR